MCILAKTEICHFVYIHIHNILLALAKVSKALV